MITTVPKRSMVFICLLFFAPAQAQDLRAFNQNESRSNHTRSLSFSFSPVYSTSTTQSRDSLLFRGNGGGFRFGADYFFGTAGIGFSSGFGSVSADNSSINNFLKSAGIPPDQLIITRTGQQNMYLLLGPTIRFGTNVQLYAHAKGGLFINNGGLVNIQQQGTTRAAYRNEPGGKSVYPGFQTGLGVQYSIKSGQWSLGVSADYLGTKTEMTNFDMRRGGGVEGLKLVQPVRDIVAGITVRYNIFSPGESGSGMSTGKRTREPGSGLSTGRRTREVGSGMATGKRTRETGSGMSTGKRSREAGSGMATGKRVLPTVNKREIAIDEPGVHRVADNCGPVSLKTTHPDGTTEERTFACPADAAEYNRNAGIPAMDKSVAIHKEGIVHRDVAARNVISGTVIWTSAENNPSYAIVTNNTVRGGSMTMNSSTSSTRMEIPPAIKGIEASFSVRETGSGMSTGKRSREAGSGMATGKRQHKIVFSDNTGEDCSACPVSVRSMPVYKDNDTKGTNPLYEGRRSGDNGLCGKTEHLIAILTDPNGQTVAKTKVEPCGDFWFANVPDGSYIIKIDGELAVEKKYAVSITGDEKMDIAGTLAFSDDWIGVSINNHEVDQPQQKAGISTSRSNLRTRALLIVDADTDGDGITDTRKILAELADGSSKDITANAMTTKTSNGGTKVIVRGWDPEKKEAISGSSTESARQYEIIIGDLDGDGAEDIKVSSRTRGEFQHEAKIMAKVSRHPGVVQYVIPLEEEGGEISTGGIDGIVFDVSTGDVDGDGVADLAAGNGFSGGTSLRPGNPIMGVTVRGGKDPANGSLQAVTNENGEFEFSALAPGDYTISIEQKIFISHETFVSTGYQTKAQDHNSSRSNKTASIIAPDPGNGDGSALKNEIGPVKWMAPESMRKRITTTHSQLTNLRAALDELELILESDPAAERSGVNTSRSNIRNQRAAINSLELALDNLQMKEKAIAMNELDRQMATMNRQFFALQDSLEKMGRQYNTISNVLKTRHDIAMNAIRNMK